MPEGIHNRNPGEINEKIPDLKEYREKSLENSGQIRK